MGAAFNNLMEEESKESLARMCCGLMDEIATLKKPVKSYEFLNPDFLEAMNDIGRPGHEVYGANAIEVAENKTRVLPRHQKAEILRHAHQHLWLYEDGVKHDKTGNLQGHLGAVAFNAMLEFYFSQGE